MSFKTWLLTGTSIGLMAVAPLPANAQGAELQSAIQSYLQAQASGDAAALEAAQSALTNECIVAGFSSVEECLASSGAAPAAAPAVDNSAAEAEAAAAAQAEADAAAAAEAEAAAAAQAEADAAAQAEADAAAQAEADARAAAEAEAAAAAEAEAAAAAQAQADAEAAAAAQAAADQQAADDAAAAQAQADAEAAAAAEAEAAAAAQAEADAAAAAAQQEQPAPEAPVEAPAAPEAPVEAPAPAPEAAPTVPAEVAPAPVPAVDYQAELSGLVTDYDTAVSDLLNGANADEVNQRLAAIRAEIAQICSNSGNADVASCLAGFGLSLPEVPGAAAQPPVEQPVEQAVTPEVPVEQPAPVEETTSDGQAAEPITELPAGIEAEQIAPLLDSAKDEPIEVIPVSEPVEGQPAVEAPAVLEPTIVTLENLPVDDQAAQSEEIRAMVATPIPLVTEEVGTQVTATENTTVNQTVVNNYVTNIVNNVSNVDNSVTNNTTVNNTVTNNTQNNTTIGQQNNLQNNYVQVVEAPVLQPTSTGDVIAQVILQVGTHLIVNSIGQDTDRFYNPQQDEIFYEDLRGGRTREVITRPDGTQVITVRNSNGDILRRSRITPDGQEYVLAYFDDRYENNLNTWRDPGLDLPPLRLNIPARDYVLDARYADDRQLTTFFAQPPVEQVARLYSIDEVKRSARIRDSVRKLEVGNLTFETAAATIGRDQVGSLQSVANAMLALLRTNPNETFLIEGHSDAVGSDIANLRLSDARAATVARVLSDFYGVPPENLATQGYGERYLKIRTEAAERENRRVTIRRITPLVTVASR